MSDPLVDIMTPEELGGYFRLLLVSWQQDEPGYLPNDPAMLASWSRLGAKWGKAGPAILRCFRVADDGRLYQKRMVQVAANAAEYREKQRVKGVASAAARNANRGSTVVQPRLSSGCLPVDERLQPEVNPLSPSPSLKTPLPPSGDSGRTRKPRAKKPDLVAAHREQAAAALDEVNAARKRVRASAGDYGSQDANLKHIAGRLAAGYTLADIRHVIAVREAECRRSPDQFQWFNASTPFREDNFTRALGADPHQRIVGKGESARAEPLPYHEVFNGFKDQLT